MALGFLNTMAGGTRKFGPRQRRITPPPLNVNLTPPTSDWFARTFPNVAAGRGFHPFARNGVDMFGRPIGGPITGQGTLAAARVPGNVDPRAALDKPMRGLGVSPHGETPAQMRMRLLLEQTGGVAGNMGPPGSGPEMFRGLDRMGFLDMLRGENAAAPQRRQAEVDAWNRSQISGAGAPRSAGIAGQGQYLGTNWGQPQFGPVGGGGPMPVPTFAEQTANGAIPPGYMSAEEAKRLGFMTPGGGALQAFYPRGMPFGWTPGSPVPLPQRKRY